ncbi:type VII secretion integral membrane protein EccD [Mangrovihabitans endophyticus]|uniref:Type VII secretion integral membrane protein EccD n=1 Tax=Mangrovihabitans endophyticus TaxID=1751298 RepID=A0A8J3FPR1_9ACTN|nr:type VII secretion integral membrane protein EccD [Mangrovihabitans endophyticus]GGL03491.1 type VII secretion integral membrane protein EccD [Mangrovihabitans endophyticus]
MAVGLARVTISAPQRRIDVALPEHVPVAELLPEVLRHAGESLADDGEKHGGWVLRRPDGAPLSAAQGLFAQGVRDGEVLHLVAARAQWPELEYDDVVEAIAEGARRRGAVWQPGSTRTATLIGAAVLLVFGLTALLTRGPRWPGGAVAGLGVAILLLLCAVTAARAYGDARAGAALGACALPYAFTGGAALVASAPGDRVGVLPVLPWLGGPELLAGAVALLVAAVLAGVGVAASLRTFTAGVTIGLLGALAALVSLVGGADTAAAALLAALVCGIGTLPLLAIRLGKVPTPPVNLPTGSEAEEGFTAAPAGVTRDAVRDRPARSAVFAAVSRTDDLLAGMLAGHTVLCAGAFLVLAAVGGMWARILMAVSAVALLLRSRLFVTLRQRVPLIAAGLSGVVALGVDLLAAGGPGTWLALTAAGLVLGLATVAAGATWSDRPPSPYLGRAADLLDTLVVVAVIPVACAVAGLYGAVMNLGPS